MEPVQNYQIAEVQNIAFRPRSYSLGTLEKTKHRFRDGNVLFEVKNPLMLLPLMYASQSSHANNYEEKKQNYLNTIWGKACQLSKKGNKVVIYYWNMYKAKLLAKIRYLKIVPGFLLLVAVLVASTNLWLNDAELTTLLVAAGIIFFNALFLYIDYCCTNNDGFSAFASSLWWGLLLGSFTFGTHHYRTWIYDDRDKLMDMLVMTSTALKCCCDFLDRFCEDVYYKSVCLLPTDLGTLIGMLVGGVIFLNPRSDGDLCLIILASALVILNLRMKCTLGFLYLFLFVAISGIAVFDNIPVSINPYALFCYHLRLFFPPATDFYFSPLSAMERWSWSFQTTRCKHSILMIIVFLIEGLFCSLAFYVILLHPEYELVFVIPVVSVSGLLWLCTHFACLSTEIALAKKLAECQEFYHKLPTTSGGTSLPHIMSSKGVRNLCLIGQQTMACALLTTFVFGAISWRRENATYPALLLLVIGLECASFGRIRELAVKLGGTCVACAIITSTIVTNPNAKITIVPADSIQKQNDRATSLITAMHRFFALYLIDNLGCDYSTSGLSLNAAEEKLKGLFSNRKKEGNGDGVRCDTYIFYYSGLTSEDGSCILADGALLSPEHVIELWQESCRNDNSVTPSRLLLILDVTNAEPWLKVVSSLRHDYVAVQTCKISNSFKRDIESGIGESAHRPGSFTNEWVQWNYDVTNDSGVASNSWFDDDGADALLKPVYGVSRRWTDFALRVPTTNDGELSNHWKVNYSFLCRPCLNLSAFCARRLNLVRLLSAPGRRYRRLKMRWFPPSVLDTGHGFKLVRS